MLPSGSLHRHEEDSKKTFMNGSRSVLSPDSYYAKFDSKIFPLTSKAEH